MSMEEEKPIPGYEGCYTITWSGVVTSLPRHRSRQKRIVLKSYIHPPGYPAVVLSKDNKKKVQLIHRMLALVFIPRLDGQTDVNHIDGDKTNFDLSNLEWCTHQENMVHAGRTGLMGHLNVKRKITAEDARDIIMFHKAGLGYRTIAKVYPISHKTVEYIVNGKLWGEKIAEYETNLKGEAA